MGAESGRFGQSHRRIRSAATVSIATLVLLSVATVPSRAATKRARVIAAPSRTVPTTPRRIVPKVVRDVVVDDATIPEVGPATDVVVASSSAPSSEGNAAMLALVNQERAAQGLALFSWDATLERYAMDWDRDMSVNGFRHRDLTTLNQPKGVGVGENIAWGRLVTIDDLHRGLMNSPGHRANILNPRFKRIGLGVLRVENELWITQEFAT